MTLTNLDKFWEFAHRYREELKEYYFDPQAARRVVVFFERELVHYQGPRAHMPFILERWQKKLLRRLFGWKHRETHLRKYKTLYLEIPRKNGKSALASGLGLYLLDADKEAGAQVVSAAADTEQAAIVFNTAKEMVAANPKLSGRINSYRRSMSVYQTASTYRVISGDSKRKHGGNLSGIIVDEVHEQPNRELIDVLVTSTAYRSQPMTILLTTAGYDKNSICWEYHDYATCIKDGTKSDPSFLGVIFAADAEDDWKDPKVWAKANPNLGVTVRMDYLEQECRKAKSIPAYENTFKRLHLNIWTEQDTRWMPIDLWDSCTRDYREEELHGRECYGGLDLSSTTDIAAFALVFPLPNGRRRSLEWYWIPENSVARRVKQDRTKYDEWVRRKFIKVTEGAVCDYDVVRSDIVRLATIFDIKEIAIDRWNATQLATQLMGENLEVSFCGQGYSSLSPPTKELSALILAEKLEHQRNEVTRWMVKNVAVETDAAGNIKPSKRKSKEKIDGVVAIIMGLSRVIVAQNEESAYADRGLIVF